MWTSVHVRGLVLSVQMFVCFLSSAAGVLTLMDTELLLTNSRKK